MDQSTSRSSSGGEIRGLTLAVWALVLALILNAGVAMFTHLLSPVSTGTSPIGSGSETLVDEHTRFHEWPLERQIQGASVIAMTIYEEEDGQLKSIISEILKQQPGVTFHYEIGDEWARGSRQIEKNIRYGEGEVIFFTGSPAMMRYSATYSGGRVGGIGDIPLQTLKDMIKREK